MVYLLYCTVFGSVQYCTLVLHRCLVYQILYTVHCLLYIVLDVPYPLYTVWSPGSRFEGAGEGKWGGGDSEHAGNPRSSRPLEASRPSATRSPRPCVRAGVEGAVFRGASPSDLSRWNRARPCACLASSQAKRGHGRTNRWRTSRIRGRVRGSRLSSAWQ